MKIALLGAAGSGKTKFAKSLARSLAKDGSKPTIIDGYVEDLQKRTGQAYDYTANYAENFQIIFHRRTREQEAALKGLDTITCGTVYETYIYTTIYWQTKDDYPRLNYEDSLRARGAMTYLGQLQDEFYDYEAMFYLPYKHEVLVNKGASWDTVVNAKIGETLEGFEKECVILDGSDKENLKYATEIIGAIRTHKLEATEDEQPAVRGSSEDDSLLTEEARRMSDLRSEEDGDSSGDQGVAS